MLGAPDAQRWWVTVTGTKLAKGTKAVSYELRVFLVPEKSAGNATPSPRPLTGALGNPSTLTVRWTGLTAGTPNLGLPTYGADLTAFRRPGGTRPPGPASQPSSVEQAGNGKISEESDRSG